MDQLNTPKVKAAKRVTEEPSSSKGFHLPICITSVLTGFSFTKLLFIKFRFWLGCGKAVYIWCERSCRAGCHCCTAGSSPCVVSPALPVISCGNWILWWGRFSIVGLCRWKTAVFGGIFAHNTVWCEKRDMSHFRTFLITFAASWLQERSIWWSPASYSRFSRMNVVLPVSLDIPVTNTFYLGTMPWPDPLLRGN